MYRAPNKGTNVICWHCKCDCGNECDVRIKDLRSGKTQSCGCLRSVKELEISNYLKQLNIQFFSQHTFKDLYFQTPRCPLRFDFALYKDLKLVGLIEYQGNQHFYPIAAFGGIKDFELRIQRDKLKKEYCQTHNIPLLYIYPDESITIKIDHFLNEVYY